MEECKKIELFYNYDDKFVPNHHCATQKLYVLDVKAPLEQPKEAFKEGIMDIKEEPEKIIDVVQEISCNYLYIISSPYTMKCHKIFM